MNETIKNSRHLHWQMYRTFVGIGIICSLIIVSVYVFTAPIIHQNKIEALEKAINKVLPNARHRVYYQFNEHHGFEKLSELSTNADLLYAGYDEYGTLIGIAIEAQGMGYQDTIELLYGYQPDNEVIVGIEVLSSRETPGLGDKIRTDSVFLQNFTQLDVSLNSAKTQTINPITLVKPGKKQNPWEIDSITGATVSSKAIATILRSSVERWLPLILTNLKDFNRDR